MDPLKAPDPNSSEGVPLPPGSWVGNLPNRRPSRGGGFSAINIERAKILLFLCAYGKSRISAKTSKNQIAVSVCVEPL